jgi:hypothetical protein
MLACGEFGCAQRNGDACVEDDEARRFAEQGTAGWRSKRTADRPWEQAV